MRERLRHPARGRGGQGVEHRARLADRRRRRCRSAAAAATRPSTRCASRGEAPIAGRAHDARLPHQPHLRGLERDHAPVHRARGGGQAPRGRRRAGRPEDEHRREARGAAEDHRVLRVVVPDALPRLEPVAEVPALRRARARTCATASAPRAGSRARCSTAWCCTGPSSSSKQAFLFRAGRHRQRAVRDHRRDHARASRMRRADDPNAESATELATRLRSTEPGPYRAGLRPPVPQPRQRPVQARARRALGPLPVAREHPARRACPRPHSPRRGRSQKERAA